MRGPIETKVVAGAAGSGAGAAVSLFLLWLFGVTVWHTPAAADHAAAAVAAVPTPVTGLVGIAVTVAGSAVAGWLAPHTARPDLGAPGPTPPTERNPA